MANYFFRLPKITDLTTNQESSLYEKKPLRLCGEAGTGKSIVSIFRHIMNVESGITSAIITFTKNLQFYIHASILSENQDAASTAEIHLHELLMHIHRDDWVVSCQEIILDEAQDFSYEEFKTFRDCCYQLTYGTDSNQNLYQGKISQQDMMNLCPNNVPRTLGKNFRNTYKILRFVYAFCFELNLDYSILEELERRGPIGVNPIVNINKNNEKDIIDEIISRYNDLEQNIGILVPFQDDVVKYDNILSDLGYEHSFYASKNHMKAVMKDIHICTFKSAKGLEFDTVIIPKINLVDENFRVISINDYYVGLTRARTNLFLISDKPIQQIKRFVNIDDDVYDFEIFKNHNTKEGEIPQIDIDDGEIPF